MFKPVTILALLVVLGCTNETTPPSIPPRDLKPSTRVVALFGGAAAIDIVQNASSVSAYRIKTPLDLNKKRIEVLSAYTNIAGPFAVPHDTVAQLRKALLDDKIYEWDTAKACGVPNYGVQFQFERNGNTLDVLICFDCNIAGIFRNGVLVSEEDCDGARSQLVEIAKALFKDDQVVQSLKVKMY